MTTYFAVFFDSQGARQHSVEVPGPLANSFNQALEYAEDKPELTSFSVVPTFVMEDEE